MFPPARSLLALASLWLGFAVAAPRTPAEEPALQRAWSVVENANALAVKNALITIAREGIVEDLPQLLKALKNPELLVLFEGPTKEGRIANEELLQQLLRDLARTNTELAERALLKLLRDETFAGKAGDTKTPLYERRRALIEALGYLQPRVYETIPWLQLGLKNDRLGVDSIIPLESLARIGSPKAAQVIEEELFPDHEHFPGDRTKHYIRVIAMHREQPAMFELLLKITQTTLTPAHRTTALVCLTENHITDHKPHVSGYDLPRLDLAPEKTKTELRQILAQYAKVAEADEDKKLLAKLQKILAE